MCNIHTYSAFLFLSVILTNVKADTQHVARPQRNPHMTELSNLVFMSSPFMTPNLRIPRRAKQQQPTSYHSQAAQFYIPNYQPPSNNKPFYDPSYEPSTYRESFDSASFDPAYEPSSYQPSFKEPAAVKVTDHENAETRLERQSGGGGHDTYVDFGAHTGHHGSFGWYADFPAHKDA